MAVMEGFGPQLLTAMGASPEVAATALSYLRLRALSAPAVMAMAVGQGACLGRQDSRTPLFICILAAIVNVAGDYWLTIRGDWGVAGAAMATLFAQLLGAAAFLWLLRPRSSSSIEPRLARRMANGQPWTRPLELRWHSFPSASDLQPFARLAGPLILRLALGMSVYTLLARVAASGGLTAMAGHHVAMQLFWTLSYFCEPLSVAAQSLIASGIRRDPQRVRIIARWLVLVAGGLGALLALIVAAVSMWGGPLLSTDYGVRSYVRSVVPQNMLSELLCAVAVTLEGIAIGAGDFGYLPSVQFFNLISVSFALFAVQYWKMGLKGVWWTLVLFFATRCAAHVLHIALSWHENVLGAKPPQK